MVARAFERDSLFSLIAGPLVWSVHFLSIYVFTALACARGFFHDEVLGIRLVPLVGSLLSLVAIALIVDALWLSWRRWRGDLADDQPPPAPSRDGDAMASRRQFMAYAGLLLSGVALIATIWQTLPVFFFASCR
jgi:hypothetical protein